MTNGKIYIDKYDWIVYFYFDIDDDNLEEVSDKLKSVGADEQQIAEANLTFEDYRLNLGVTFSNCVSKVSVIIITKTSDASQFINSFSHEVRHVENHIAKTYNIDENSEEVCYMIGYISQKLYKRSSFLFCDCCRNNDY